MAEITYLEALREALVESVMGAALTTELTGYVAFAVKGCTEMFDWPNRLTPAKALVTTV